MLAFLLALFFAQMPAQPAAQMPAQPAAQTPAKPGTQAPAKPAPAKPAPPPTFFTTPLSIDQMKGKQAVVDTSLGTFVIQLLPEAAPNHVGHFMKLAQEGAYTGTTFHRVIKYGIIQGGDPISKDPAKRDLYGTGGLKLLRAEITSEKATRGAVAGVLVPNDRDSAGAQFFICVTDQPAIDGQYTIFGRVVEGMDVVQKISESPADEKARTLDRIEIKTVTIRDTPPPEVEPFSTEPVEELGAYRATLQTSLGPIAIEFFADKAPGHVRNFLRLAQAGVYDGTSFHRVVPGFVVQTGFLTSRQQPLTEKQKTYVRNLSPEFNDTRHVKGIVSMARGDDPNSAQTSFFICTGTSTALDGVYTAFGKVVDGLQVLDAIEAVPRDGEAPKTRIELTSVKIEKVR